MVFGCAGLRFLYTVFSSCGERGLLSSCGVWSSHCGGFSCCGARHSHAWASVVAAHGLGCPGACGIFPDTGIEPVSPALAVGFCNHWATRDVPTARCWTHRCKSKQNKIVQLQQRQDRVDRKVCLREQNKKWLTLCESKNI